MSNLCSLAWCRKPITSRRKSRKFPSDRPSQLAWLDALDAGAWFSIPPETLCTGLILCENHFDSKGNVKRRYDAPVYNSSPIKMEPNVSGQSEEEEEADNAEDDGRDSYDSDYTPDTSSRSKRKGANVREVRVNIIRLQSDNQNQKRKAESEFNSSSKPKRTKRRTKAAIRQSESEGEIISEADPDDAAKTIVDPGTDQTSVHLIDPKRLSELTSDAVQRSSVKNNNNQTAKRQSVTLMQKMEVIRLVDQGVKQSQISKQMNVRRSTIWSITQNREKIEEAYRAGAPLRKRIVRKGAFADINEAVYQWYEKVRTQNLFVNARVLLTMAENIANELGRTDFTPSPNWLTRFKERYNIRFSSTPAKPRPKPVAKRKKEVIEGELKDKADDDCHEEEEAAENKEIITSEVEDSWLRKDWLRNTWAEIRVKNLKTREPYAERDVFFVEELGILYRITPKQAWQFRSGKTVDSMENFSITEERLTVVLCSSADGSEKRKLLVVGQAQDEMPKNLPADYITTSDPSNWITKSAFARWLKKWNNALQSQNRKIILVSNSSPIHIFASNFSNIKIANIPTRLLSSLHPVNYGIATNFKTRYRRLLVERLISTGSCRSVTCLEAIFMFCTAWNELSPDLIRAAFLKAGYFSSSDVPNIPEDQFDCSSLIAKAAELDIAVPLSKYPFSAYVEIDNSLCAVECTVLGGSETADADDSNADDFSDNEADDNVGRTVTCHLTAADAQIALENMRLFAMSRASCPQEVHNALSTLESFLLGHNL